MIVRKYSILPIILVLALALSGTAVVSPKSVQAAPIEYVSDTSTRVALSFSGWESGDFGPWQDAVITYRHPSWPNIIGARYIATADHVENPLENSWRKFERTFTVAPYSSGVPWILEINVDNAYIAYLNGVEVGSEGVVEGKLCIKDGLWATVDTWHVTPVVGANTLTVITRNYCKPNSTWRDNPSGLIYKISRQYALTMKVEGCGNTTPTEGDHYYTSGTVVDISAHPCLGWYFCGWTDDPVDNPDSRTTTVTMDSDKTVTANFCGQPTLTVKVKGCGNTTPTEGDHFYALGTVVDISAYPCPGWEFCGWTDDPVDDPDSPNTKVTIDSDKTVTANFCEKPTLTVKVEGCGTTAPEVGSHEYERDEVVDISAFPCEGWEFEGWTCDAADPKSLSTTIIMDRSKTCTAVFTCTRILTVKKNGEGSTSPPLGTSKRTCDEVVDLTATPKQGWLFVRWDGDVANPSSPTTTVKMDSDKTVVANFSEAPPVTLTVKVNGCGLTSPPVGTSTHVVGSRVNLSATPCPGWQFVRWDGDVANPSSPTTTVTMDSDKTVVANFSEKLIEPQDVQLAILLDGSSSISAAEWDTEINGLYGAVNDGTIPPDGSVELTVIQFAGHIGARTEIPPTVIRQDNYASVAQQVKDIVKSAGITPIEDGINLAVQELRASSWFGPTRKQIINISSDIGEYTLSPPAIVAARNAAINSATGGIDEINAEGIGDISAVDVDWLKNKIVYPQPGTEAPPFTPGWVYVVSGPSDFKRAIGEKVRPAPPPEIGYTLIVSSSNGGSVTEPGEGFKGPYPDGTVVQLTAEASSGWVFDRWTGNVANPLSLTTTITMNQDQVVGAGFKRLYTLIIRSNGEGSVIEPGEGTFLRPEGAVVRLSTKSDLGWIFDSWTGNVADWLSDTTTINMYRNQTVTANFREVGTYTLVTGSTVGGSVSVPGEGVFTFSANDVVSLVATEETGWLFDSWIGNVYDRYSPSTTITMDQDQVVSANFVRSYTLTIRSSLGGSVTQPGEGPHVYKEGSVVNLEATADSGKAFESWTGDVADRFSRITTITMTRDEQISANFAKGYTLGLTSSVGGSITEPGEGIFIFPEDAVVELTAKPDPGRLFQSWTGDVVNPSLATTTIIMNKDQVVTAIFSDLVSPWPTAYKTLVMQVSGGITSPAVGEHHYPVDAVVHISAFPIPGWGFDGWTGDVTDPSSAVTTVTMDSDKTITARFSALTSGNTLVIQVSGSGTTTPPLGTPHLYSPGAIVRISATPSPGWKFFGWTSNVAHPLLPDTTVTMNNNKVVTAYFNPVSSGGGGAPPPPPLKTPVPPLTPTTEPTRTPGPTRPPTSSPTPTPTLTPPVTTQTPAPTVTPTATPQQPVVLDLSAVIDATGVIGIPFKYVTPDGMVGVDIESGTISLTADGRPLQNIVIQEICAGIPPLPDGQIVGCAYDFGPDGATFDPPIMLTLRYNPGLIQQGVAEESLGIARYDAAAGQWIPLASAVDTANHTAMADVDRFTMFAVYAPAPTLTPTPTPVSEPAQVPWSLIMGTIAAVVGVGVLFYVLRKRM